MAERDVNVPPAGEEVHMPEPSLVPIINAAGLAVALVGLTITYYLTAVGAAVFLVSLVKWIRDVVHDISELPAEHRAH